MPSAPSIAPATADKIARLRRHGLSVAELAERFGLSRHTVDRIITRAQRAEQRADIEAANRNARP